MDWKAFGLGACVAALSGALHYAEVLPSPYGAMASAILAVVTLFMTTPRGDK